MTSSRNNLEKKKEEKKDWYTDLLLLASAADARKTNGSKFGTIPDDSNWKLSEDAAFVYFCDNETVNGV